MILAAPFPPDIRVEKEMKTLMREHEVHLLCTLKNGQANLERWGGIRIKRVFSKYDRWQSNLQLMATCFSRNWEIEIQRYVKEFNIDVLHVHDLPLLGTTLRVAKKLRLPVVADLHENYPQMLAEGRKTPVYKQLNLGKIALRLIVSINRWIEYEREALSKADKVITVIEEARDRLVHQGLSAENIHVVANYDDGTEESYYELGKKRMKPNGKFQVIYAGGFDATRDLRTVIDSTVRISKEEIPDLKILLVGGKGSELAALRKYMVEKFAMNRISLVEWSPLEEVRNLIKNSQVGLVPHIKSAHTDTTIPHKLFQYMAEGLPVVVSDCTPLKRIVIESGCGLVYRSGDSRSLAGCLSQLYSDLSMWEKMSEAGYEAVRNRYNWKIAGEELLHIYRHLSERDLADRSPA